MELKCKKKGKLIIGGLMHFNIGMCFAQNMNLRCIGIGIKFCAHALNPKCSVQMFKNKEAASC